MRATHCRYHGYSWECPACGERLKRAYRIERGMSDRITVAQALSMLAIMAVVWCWSQARKLWRAER